MEVRSLVRLGRARVAEGSGAEVPQYASRVWWGSNSHNELTAKKSVGNT